MLPAIPSRPRSTLLTILLLWIAFYASFTLFTPALLDDADSVHVEVAREMLLRHDYITLYANGIRYLEKAPLLYWAMALCLKLFGLFGVTSPNLLAAAARLPLALAMLALALLTESFARRLFHNPQYPFSGRRAGLYAALITLSSFGLFIFTRITIPDAVVCLFTTLAIFCFWRTEELDSSAHSRTAPHLRLYCGGFAAACALNVLTKGLIGVVFPVGIVLIYLILTRGIKRAARRLRELHLWASLEAFLVIAAPWHILAGLANPTEGHPAHFRWVAKYRFPLSLGHWIVPLPTYGNVHGWFWFYFMNEHVLRYLNLRVPHDYDTSPLWLFWGLCFLWIMPWSAFLFKAIARAAPIFGKTEHTRIYRSQFRRHDLPLTRRGALLLLLWAALILLFFALSTRQEYYVLPALPALAILLAGWLAHDSLATQTLASHPSTEPSSRPAIEFSSQPATELSSRPTAAHFAAAAERPAVIAAKTSNRAAIRCIAVLLILGSLYAAFAMFSLLHTQTPAPNTDLASLLQQHPADYALSMGHFLDLNAQSLGLFRAPLILSAIALFFGPLAALILRRKARPHPANLALATATFVFLLAAHLALQTFAPVLSSAQLARAIALQLHPNDLIAIHGEYESGSSLAFYLKRPTSAGGDIHILDGRSSNLWYGSFFTDSPPIFETPQSFAAKWASPRRIFLWQSLTDPPNQLPPLPGPVYILAKSGGKEIVSNQPNH